MKMEIARKSRSAKGYKHLYVYVQIQLTASSFLPCFSYGRTFDVHQRQRKTIDKNEKPNREVCACTLCSLSLSLSLPMYTLSEYMLYKHSRHILNIGILIRSSSLTENTSYLAGVYHSHMSLSLFLSSSPMCVGFKIVDVKIRNRRGNLLGKPEAYVKLANHLL